MIERQAIASSHAQTPVGAIDSEQRLAVHRPVVTADLRGARRLGDVYWRAVAAYTRGIVRPRVSARGLELRLLGVGPALLRFAGPILSAHDGSVVSRYRIVGGLLARTPAGSISFEQSESDPVQLRSAITGFFPRLAARPGRPRWTGALYGQVQVRLHLGVSRRYFARLLDEAGS